MVPADSHIHSRISKDCGVSRADMAAAAYRGGLSEICFTDHYDVIDMDGSYNPRFDWAPVREEQSLARALWGEKITLHYGLELGNAPRDFAAAERALAEPGLDFVLCSVHNLCAEKGGTDFYDVRYDRPELAEAHLDDYFRTMEQSVRWGKFDVLAHIPYPLRYMRDRDGLNLSLDPRREQIRAILKNVIENGSGVEVNTKVWQGETIRDYTNLLSDYRDLGGEIVTVGSDAHTTAGVGGHIGDACELLRSLGFRYIAVYTNRKPRFVSLEES